MATIAILGYGTVGSGVLEVLRRNAASIERRAGQLWRWVKHGGVTSDGEQAALDGVVDLVGDGDAEFGPDLCAAHWPAGALHVLQHAHGV